MFPSRPARGGRSSAGVGDSGSSLSQPYILRIAQFAVKVPDSTVLSKTRGAPGGHSPRAPILAAPASPSPSPAPAPAPAAPPATSRQALPFPPGQAAQLTAQILQRLRPHRVPLAPEDRETHRTVEWG